MGAPAGAQPAPQNKASTTGPIGRPRGATGRSGPGHDPAGSCRWRPVGLMPQVPDCAEENTGEGPRGSLQVAMARAASSASRLLPLTERAGARGWTGPCEGSVRPSLKRSLGVWFQPRRHPASRRRCRSHQASSVTRRTTPRLLQPRPHWGRPLRAGGRPEPAVHGHRIPGTVSTPRASPPCRGPRAPASQGGREGRLRRQTEHSRLGAWEPGSLGAWQVLGEAPSPPGTGPPSPAWGEGESLKEAPCLKQLRTFQRNERETKLKGLGSLTT